MKRLVKKITTTIKKRMVCGRVALKRLQASLFFPCTKYQQIPIIINNFNRLGYLQRMLKSLEKKGYTNIIILDNASTYPPLLEYYNNCEYEVIRLKHNYGHKSLAASGVLKRFDHSYFVYSDPDLELLDECPDDFLLQMLDFLRQHPKVDKIALSLKIDDLPDCYEKKQQVIEWESRFSQKTYHDVYVADVDTTFALYQPNAIIGYDDNDFACRMPYPIQCRHLPWYEDSSIVSEEDEYYLQHKRTDVSWWMQPK